MKRILRAKKTGSGIDKISLIPIPKQYNPVNLKALSEASTLPDAVNSLKNTEFSGAVEALPIYQKYGLISVIEGALDRTYFESDVLPSLRGVPDGRHVREMVGLEIDLTNLKTMMDLRAREVGPDAVRSLSLKPMKLKAKEVEAISMARIDTIPDIVSKSHYSSLARPLREALDTGKVASLDRVFALEVYKGTKALMVRCADTFVYVLGYVMEAEAEAHNLVSIATGKELGLDEPKIDSTLFV
jgi:vacuolar-type H+-ATPase subunit C/Vma6